MAGYNKVVMVGNLTRDPEYKQLPSGQAVCRLGLASNRQFRNRQSNEMVQEVCFVDVDVWGAQAESCKNYLAKGRQVLVEGRLKLDSWQDAEGQNRSKHSIVAERVVFLSNNSGAEISDVSSDETSDYGSRSVSRAAAKPSIEDLQKEVAQIQAAKLKAAAPKAVAKPKAKAESDLNLGLGSGEIEFKDEPPFQDDLPF